MKVIGMGEHDAYLCLVTHTELEKLADKYYGKLQRLRVGSEMNLGAGYDFRSDIQTACRGMVDAEKNFDRAKNTLHKFAVMVAALPTQEEEPA